jgi:HPt (histidine-containing phosphotransfer) domain-containing protein
LPFDATNLISSAAPPLVTGINRDSLIVELRGSDPDLMTELGTVFLEQEPRQRRKLLDSIFTGDRRGLAAAAHSLRGSLFIFGADSAAEIVEELELSAEEIDLAHAYEKVETLESELGKLTAYIKGLMRRSHQEIHDDHSISR